MKHSWWHRIAGRKVKKLQSRRRCPLRLELLEPRQLLSGYRTITGFDNNLANPTWGQAGTDLLRISPVAYADGISAPFTLRRRGKKNLEFSRPEFRHYSEEPGRPRLILGDPLRHESPQDQSGAVDIAGVEIREPGSMMTPVLFSYLSLPES